MAVCDGFLHNCECNRKHDLAHCLRCMGIRQHGLSLIDARVRTVPLISPKYEKQLPVEVPSQFESLEELKSFTIGEFDLGMAVFSSLVDRLASTNPDVSRYRDIVRNLSLDAWRVWMSAAELLSEHQFDKVYIFNGRYATARPWVRACQQAGVPFVTHEKSGHVEKILLFEDCFPHEPTQYAERVEKFWKSNAHNDIITAEGAEFFEERPRGELSGWISFVSAQEKDKLPLSWDASRRNIAVFATTDGEYVGLKDLFADGLYPDQSTAYLDVSEQACHRDNNIFFYIRLHPNSIHESVKWWEYDLFRKARNVEVIPADSRISSYALMAASEKCMTFLSSAGLEATYWGKASMILGKAFYSGVDAVFETKTREEAYAWIVGKPKCNPKINAIKFGAYMRCGGEALPYSESVSYYTLKFKGEVLEARREVHEWLGECEKRPTVTGIKKWLQDRSDKKRFHQIIKECGGDLAASSQAG